jgi:hypothetical protein
LHKLHTFEHRLSWQSKGKIKKYGAITTGATYEDVQKNIREAIALHLRGMVEDHEPIPVPQTTAEYADVSLPDSAA